MVSPYSFVLYATNNYSVDINYVGQAVQVRIYAKQIIIEHQAKIIGNHPRCFGRHERIYDPWHYVPLLERKPGALRNGAPFKRLRLPVAMQSVRKQLSHYSDPDRRFIRILLYVIQYGLEAVEEACRVALLQGGCNDTVILSYLKPPVEQPLEQAFLIKLSAPPTEDCHSYNQAYLPQTMNNVEVSHVA